MLTARTTMDLFVADQEPEIMDGVPNRLIDILIKATRYRREERYPSMRALAKDLYHAKAEMPEDPPQTPPLIMRDVDEYDSELPLYQTAETHFSKLGGQTEDTENSFGTNSFSDELGSRTSTPSIPRQKLLREDIVEEAPPFSWKFLLLPLFALFTLVLLLIGVASSGANTINNGIAEIEAIQLQANSVLDAERELVPEMMTLGAPQKRIEESWAQLREAVKNQDPKRFTVEIRALQEVLQDNEPSPTSTRLSTARSAGQRLKRLTGFGQRWQREVDAIALDAQTTSAQLAVKLGWADPPAVP